MVKIKELKIRATSHVCKYSHWTSVLSNMCVVFEDISIYILFKRVVPPPLTVLLSDEESISL